MAERPNVNPTPKAEFLANPQFVKMHRDMMQQPMLTVSIQYAMLHYQRVMAEARSVDATAAATSFFKIQGALEFISLLKNLAEMPEIPKTIPNQSKLIQS